MAPLGLEAKHKGESPMNPNEELDLSDSKGQLVASLAGNDDGTFDITLWNPPQPDKAGQGGNPHFVLSQNSLILKSKTGKSRIVFSFSDNEEPTIELFQGETLVWSSDD